MYKYIYNNKIFGALTGLLIVLAVSHLNPIFSQSTISGHLRYLNTNQTPMDGVKVFLFHQGYGIQDSIKTGLNGEYHFSNLAPGYYSVVPHCTKLWGGANSVDALLVQKHVVGMSFLEGLRLRAADVNASNSVSSIDAFLILKRFCGMITTFDAGDWTFENEVYNLDGIQGSITYDFYGLCFGDIDGSFVPKPCIPAPTIADAGPDVLQSATDTVSLHANTPLVGTGQWKVLLGNNCSFSDVSDPNSTFTGPSGVTYILTWNISTACFTSVDTTMVSFAMTVMPCPGIPSFFYGGQTYNTVQIGTQCWMKESLNLGHMIIGDSVAANNGIIEKYCYDNDPANCTTYGGLYSWNEIMQYTNIEGTQGICPTGWHIPSTGEYEVMVTALGGTLLAGHKLKEAGIEHWLSGNTASNESGFTARGGGNHLANGAFQGYKALSNFWTSSFYNDSIALFEGMEYNDDWMWGAGTHNDIGFALRCIKNTCSQLPVQSNAGPDQVIPGTYTQLSGNQPGDYDYSMWTIISGTGGMLDEPWYWHSGFNGIAGNTYKLVWTIYNDCSSSSDTMEVRFAVPILICGDSINYDGQNYHIVKIGNQCWMKENLNIGTMINGTSLESNNGILEKYCYNNDPGMCSVYGGLYDWDEAMQYTTTVGTQGICPQGFHLPVRNEVGDMFVFMGGNAFNGQSAKFKEEGNLHWIDPNDATNETGFTAIGAGIALPPYNSFAGLMEYTQFWTSDIWTDTIYSWGYSIQTAYQPDKIYLNPEHRTVAFSVRCLKDPCTSIPNQANAGPNQTVSGTWTLLAGNTAQTGSGEWTILSGSGGVIAEPENPATQFTGVPGVAYELKWTISTDCTSTEDTVVISFNP